MYVAQKFQRCVEDLRSTGRQWMVPEGVGIHGLGHSNGALLHLLIGSLFAVPNTSNILLSFNNKYAPQKTMFHGDLEGLT